MKKQSTVEVEELNSVRLPYKTLSTMSPTLEADDVREFLRLCAIHTPNTHITVLSDSLYCSTRKEVKR